MGLIDQVWQIFS